MLPDDVNGGQTALIAGGKTTHARHPGGWAQDVHNAMDYYKATFFATAIAMENYAPSTTGCGRRHCSTGWTAWARASAAVPPATARRARCVVSHDGRRERVAV